MKKIIIGVIVLMVLSNVVLAFAETSIKAEVDKASLTTEETLTYKITITSSDKKVTAAQIPKFEGFNVISQAQSSTISFAKGGAKTILVYAFTLAPTDKGKFRIGPSSIKVKNKTYSTDALEIEVTPGRRKSPVPPEEKPSLPEESPPESEEPQITL